MFEENYERGDFDIGGKDGKIVSVTEDKLIKQLSRERNGNVPNTDRMEYDSSAFYRAEAMAFGSKKPTLSNKQLLRIPRIVSNLKLYNVVKIYEILENCALLRGNPGYVMKRYYHSLDYTKRNFDGTYKRKSLLDFDLKYFIDNYHRLDSDLKVLWENGISPNDISYVDGNCIFSDEGIILIDVDGYTWLSSLDKLRDKLGLKTKTLKYDANKMINGYIREAIELLDSRRKKEIMSGVDWTQISLDENFDLLEELSKYDPSMTLFEYIKIKSEELGYTRKGTR